MKKFLLYACGLCTLAAAVAACDKTETKEVPATDEVKNQNEKRYECIAYACTIDGGLPPAHTVTAINYLGAEPKKSGDGVEISNIPRLRQIVALKQKNPKLKVILSLGGAGYASGWSEMTSNDELRALFIEDCKKKIAEFNLDGIDFDWEFPANAQEEANYIALFRDVREALGPDKVVSAAAGFYGNGFPLKEAMQYLDYINLMTYDMGWQAPYHHTSLRRSPLSGVCTVEESLDSCLSKGVDYKDIVLGLAFYGRGDGVNFKDWTDYRDIKLSDGMEERWDSIACVPYIVDKKGTLIIGFENPRSLKIKCDYIKEKGLRGGMYWRTEEDTDERELTIAVANGLLGK